MKHIIIPVTALQQNCSLLWCEESKKGAVIDPGGDLDKILQIASSNGVAIEKILITHAHFDHAGGANELAEKLSIPIEGPHIADKPLIERMSLQASIYGFPPVPSFTPERWLEQDDTISIGDITLRVLHCPGHTPGHVVFFHADSNLAFVGDVLFQGSIGRTDFPLSSHADLIDSIRLKLWPLGSEVTFIPGHGPNSTFGAERQNNPFVGDSQ
jgi:glyoxylase-like metal-dependent hydrolase (beta-lactamase superfamily II)